MGIGSCLTAEMKSVISKAITAEPSFAISLITALDLCSGEPAIPAATKASRAMPAQWNASVSYIDAEGKQTEYSSPSALVKALGLKMSSTQHGTEGAIICDESGKSCRATSVPEILQLQGFTVWGNGSASPIKIGVTKHFTVFHPKAPSCQLPKEVAQQTDIKKITKPGAVTTYKHKMTDAELEKYNAMPEGKEKSDYLNMLMNLPE